MAKKLLVFIGLLLNSILIFAQTAPFDVLIEPLNIEGLGGIQSYSFGQHNGKWLIVGGRLDGLHRRQPFAAFDVAGNNNQIIVVDPIAQQKWSAPLSSLPARLQEQLSSTNMQFFQEGDYLYCIGGYGYSNISADHITYPNLSAIKVPDVINAIVNGTSFSTHFRQITDTMFAVTGGYLNKIYDTYYLTGGHKFIGRYNPQGPTHGPGFVQNYTNAIRKFKILDDGEIISITHFPSIVDATNLHRRDYNVVAQIKQNGQEGLTAFSGVFQVGSNLPFLNCLNIDSSGFEVDNYFTQYYNHYHCAHIPLFSETDNEMHTVFFGGIAQYYDSLGTLVQDNDVPFVKTIARVTRNSNGTMAEYKLPIEMPAFLGSGSEFIQIENIPQFNNGIVKLDDLAADTTLVGYIYGGISSSAPNIFFTNTGTQSSASSQIFKVYISKKSTLGIDNLNKHSISSLKIQVFPNPNDGNFVVKFNLNKIGKTRISLYSINGKKIEDKVLTHVSLGENIYQRKIKNIESGGSYILTIETPFEKATQKIIINP